MELFEASRQWAIRPKDQRFWNLQDMYEATYRYAAQAKESHRPFDSIRLEAKDQDVYLQDRQAPAKVTHHAFGQICSLTTSPPEYLRELPTTLAVQCLNSRLADRHINVPKGADFANLLFHQNGSNVLRAFNTEEYKRIWNHQVVERLMILQDEQGWRVPPARPSHNGGDSRPATEEDVLSRGRDFWGSIKVGDMISPAGLYASDHDMFVFMVNENVVIDDGTESGLARGFFVRQGEVGGLGFHVIGFYYRNVCGNHIVWGASNIVEVKLNHVGDIKEFAFPTMQAELKKFANRSAATDQKNIASARRMLLGTNKNETVDAVFKMKVPELTRKRVNEAYDLAAQNSDKDGNPRSVYGMVQGLTRLSQKIPYADQRNALDRAAGKVLSVAFK